MGRAGRVLLSGVQELARAGGDLLAAGTDLLDQVTQVQQRVVEGLGEHADRLVGVLARLDAHSEVTLGGLGQHGGQVLDPLAQLVALLAGRAALVPDGGAQHADEGGDARSKRQDQHQIAGVVGGHVTSEEHRDGKRNSGSDADDQAAGTTHGHGGDEQRRRHQRPVRPIDTAGARDQPGNPDDVGDDEAGPVVLDQRALPHHSVTEQRQRCQPTGTDKTHSEPQSDGGHREVRSTGAVGEHCDGRDQQGHRQGDRRGGVQPLPVVHTVASGPGGSFCRPTGGQAWLIHLPR